MNRQNTRYLTSSITAMVILIAGSSSRLGATNVLAPLDQIASNQCLIVRSAEGHRFRNAMIAGALTGGIGLAAGAATGGGRFEYVDSFNLSNTKLKYKGGDIQKLQKEGVHVVVINKKATADETKSASVVSHK